MLVLLRKHKISFCILRNFRNLHHKLPSGDIDILIDRKSIDKLVLIINNNFTTKPYKVIRHSFISADFFPY